jgi:hypothetical protein
MDIVYLHKRLNFLERGLALLLEDHQLRALYLLNRASKAEADANFRSHALRERVTRLASAK